MALIGMGALINENTFEGALNRIITVLPNRGRAYGLPGTRPDALPLSHRKLVRAKDTKGLFT